jgi:hypothetical protein
MELGSTGAPGTSGYERRILLRALSSVNIQRIRAPDALREHVHAAISAINVGWSAVRWDRHWLLSTPISISTMFSQLACLGV